CARGQSEQQTTLGPHVRTMTNTGPQAGPWRTIVGFVSTVRMLGPFNNPGADATGYYVPFYSTPFGPALTAPLASQFATVVVKPRGGQRADLLGQALRREIAKADPNLPLYFVGTPHSQIEVFVAQTRIVATLFTIFGAVAIVLASVGIYGVMSFAVNQRTQEFGVRMALGADDTCILGMVLRQGVVQIALGVALGLGVALAIAAVAGGVSARDPLTYASVFAIVTIVSLIATMVPARRATRVDPMIALRAE